MSRLPVEFMAVMFGVTATARLADMALRRRTRRTLSELAAAWQMHYVPIDRFSLVPRVARHFPVPGGADLVIRDLIYSTEGDYYRYYFTALYTRGVVRTKSRVVRAGTCREPRDRGGSQNLLDLELAPRQISLKQQYVLLRESVQKTRQG